MVGEDEDKNNKNNKQDLKKLIHAEEAQREDIT